MLPSSGSSTEKGKRIKSGTSSKKANKNKQTNEYHPTHQINTEEIENFGGDAHKIPTLESLDPTIYTIA